MASVDVGETLRGSLDSVFHQKTSKTYRKLNFHYFMIPLKIPQNGQFLTPIFEAEKPEIFKKLTPKSGKLV